MTLRCRIHTGFCCSHRDGALKNPIDRSSLKYPQVSAANSLRLLDRGYTLPMSIDARLEELKQESCSTCASAAVRKQRSLRTPGGDARPSIPEKSRRVAGSATFCGAHGQKDL